jgi:hypothetical protein
MLPATVSVNPVRCSTRGDTRFKTLVSSFTMGGLTCRGLEERCAKLSTVNITYRLALGSCSLNIDRSTCALDFQIDASGKVIVAAGD